jgi:hypothetical protein
LPAGRFEEPIEELVLRRATGKGRHRDQRDRDSSQRSLLGTRPAPQWILS